MKTNKMRPRSIVSDLSDSGLAFDLLGQAFSGASTADLTKSIRKTKVDKLRHSLYTFVSSGGFHRHLVAKAGNGG